MEWAGWSEQGGPDGEEEAKRPKGKRIRMMQSSAGEVHSLVVPLNTCSPKFTRAFQRESRENRKKVSKIM